MKNTLFKTLLLIIVPVLYVLNSLDLSLTVFVLTTTEIGESNIFLASMWKIHPLVFIYFKALIIIPIIWIIIKRKDIVLMVIAILLLLGVVIWNSIVVWYIVQYI